MFKKKMKKLLFYI